MESPKFIAETGSDTKLGPKTCYIWDSSRPRCGLSKPELLHNIAYPGNKVKRHENTVSQNRIGIGSAYIAYHLVAADHRKNIERNYKARAFISEQP